MASLEGARAKSRDNRRIQDLNQARTALTLYRDTYGNWMYTGSGCGFSGDGSGWFNYPYSHSGMAQCLVNTGMTPSEIIDPTGDSCCSTPTNSTYT